VSAERFTENVAAARLLHIAMIDIEPCRIYKMRCVRLTSSIPLVVGDEKEEAMAWTTPTLIEICIGLEINGYLPAEF
jgi:coenzyme PQQ precursor peptide PqqA